MPNEIFVGICNFNLLISLTFMPILFGNLLFFINVKFAHFSLLYAIIHHGENKNICTRYEQHIVRVRPDPGTILHAFGMQLLVNLTFLHLGVTFIGSILFASPLTEDTLLLGPPMG